ADRVTVAGGEVVQLRLLPSGRQRDHDRALRYVPTDADGRHRRRVGHLVGVEQDISAASAATVDHAGSRARQPKRQALAELMRGPDTQRDGYGERCDDSYARPSTQNHPQLPDGLQRTRRISPQSRGTQGGSRFSRKASTPSRPSGEPKKPTDRSVSSSMSARISRLRRSSRLTPASAPGAPRTSEP